MLLVTIGLVVRNLRLLVEVAVILHVLGPIVLEPCGGVAMVRRHIIVWSLMLLLLFLLHNNMSFIGLL